MKLFLISDLRIGYSALSKDKLDIQKDYIFKFLIPTLQKHYENGDHLIILGNLYDNQDSISSSSLEILYSMFDNLSLFDIKILTNKKDNIQHLKYIDMFDNVTIYANAKGIKFDDKKTLLLPNISKKDSLNNIEKYEHKIDYLLSVNDYTINDKISIISKNVGSINYSDKTSITGLTVLDTSNDTISVIKDFISPKYHKIEVNNITDFDTINDKDFFTYTIKKSVLINDRKIKRYIDDISYKRIRINIINDIIEQIDQKDYNDDIYNIESLVHNILDDDKEKYENNYPHLKKYISHVFKTNK